MTDYTTIIKSAFNLIYISSEFLSESNRERLLQNLAEIIFEEMNVSREYLRITLKKYGYTLWEYCTECNATIMHYNFTKYGNSTIYCESCHDQIDEANEPIE